MSANHGYGITRKSQYSDIPDGYPDDDDLDDGDDQGHHDTPPGAEAIQDLHDLHRVSQELHSEHHGRTENRELKALLADHHKRLERMAQELRDLQEKHYPDHPIRDDDDGDLDERSETLDRVPYRRRPHAGEDLDRKTETMSHRPYQRRPKPGAAEDLTPGGRALQHYRLKSISTGLRDQHQTTLEDCLAAGLSANDIYEMLDPVRQDRLADFFLTEGLI
jgi:hypothetical protein